MQYQAGTRYFAKPDGKSHARVMRLAVVCGSAGLPPNSSRVYWFAAGNVCGNTNCRPMQLDLNSPLNTSFILKEAEH